MLDQIASDSPVTATATSAIALPEFSTEKVEQVRIFFKAGKPSATVRDYLKSLGARFQPGNEETLGRGYWVATVGQLANTPFVGE